MLDPFTYSIKNTSVFEIKKSREIAKFYHVRVYALRSPVYTLDALRAFLLRGTKLVCYSYKYIYFYLNQDNFY